MTIAADAHIDYIGTGLVDAYDFDFIIWDDDDLRVITRDDEGDETVLTKGTDYTVSDGPWPNGGTVTLEDPLEDGYALTIRRVRTLAQESDFRNQARLQHDTLETALDKLAAADQQQQHAIDRALKVGETQSSLSMDLENLAAGRNLRVNAAGTGIEGYEGESNDSTFTASGTGAVARTVTSKLGAIVSPLDFDGADIGEKIKQAIAALPASGGIVDGSELNETYSNSGTDPFDGIGSKTVELWLGRCSIDTLVPWVRTDKCRILGSGRGDFGSHGTVIRAAAGFAGDFILDDDGYGAVFGQVIRDLTVDINNHESVSGIRARAMNEQSGIYRVLVTRITEYGIYMDASTAGASGRQQHWSMGEIELYFASGDRSAAVGLYVDGGSSPFYRIYDVTVNGVTATVKPTNLMVLRSIVQGHVENLHFENGTNGLVLGEGAAGVNGLTGQNIQGGPSMTSVVKLDSSAPNQAFSLRGVGKAITGSVTNSIEDVDRSITLTDNYVASYEVGIGTTRPVWHVGNGGAFLRAADLTLSTGVLKVGANQVVGAQGAAVADATGAGDVVAQLNALLARLRAHGLIAT